MNHPAAQSKRYAKYIVLVGFAMALVFWIFNIHMAELQNEARIRILLACSIGTPKKEVRYRLDGQGKPRESDSWSEVGGADLQAPKGGSVLFYDSYAAGSLLDNPRLPEFVVVFDKTEHVVGTYFYAYR